MSWTYTQDKGELRDASRTLLIGTGYSGNTWGINNHAAQFQIGVGPIPVGLYTIGAPHTPVDHLGPDALPLWPDPMNDMEGRSGFFIHGDNQHANHSASNGCIILGPAIRARLRDSPDKHLRVVATAADLIPPTQP
jgi:hypothetical protein